MLLMTAASVSRALCCAPGPEDRGSSQPGVCGLLLTGPVSSGCLLPALGPTAARAPSLPLCHQSAPVFGAWNTVLCRPQKHRELVGKEAEEERGGLPQHSGSFSELEAPP